MTLIEDLCHLTQTIIAPVGLSDQRRVNRCNPFTARRCSHILRRMRSRFLVALAMLALVLLLAGCQDPPPESETFTSDEGRFRVDFPAEPERRSQNVGAGESRMELVAFTAADGDGQVFSVAYADYPQDMATDPKELLDSAVDGAASSTGGSVTSREQSTYQDNEAIEYLIDGADSQIRARAVLAGSRLYILQVVRQEDPVQASRFETFAGSLQIL